ncbi:uncharacterized protein G2W53_000727 [Senna tora]|uniref:Uncharacterized protein n=1 Tax=Senna tora TaxID=362788 RepID=A0A834XEW5_9FABA|nr:uncharacterized protein G2W53_000727 [Senna tora]
MAIEGTSTQDGGTTMRKTHTPASGKTPRGR